MIKSIIDNHFTENERYYRYICVGYYNGRYLYEDLLHEFYLAFLELPEDLILKFHNAGKLNYLGALVIRNIHSKRGNHKRNRNGSTSPLFELSNLAELVDKTLLDESKTEFEELLQSIDENVLKDKLAELYTKDWFKHDVLMLLQKESINSLSKRTGINRKYLTDSYKETCKQLSKELVQLTEKKYY